MKISPKRVNFISIQRSHAVACNGYKQVPVRTGYEQVLSHRTSELFSYTAKQDGKVISISDAGMVVEYADGTQKGLDIGRQFGSAAGLIIPHSVVTPLKEGQKFKADQILTYNEGWFEPDILNPNNVVWKAGIVINVALMESTSTLEDSSAISKKTAQLLTTKATKIKVIVVKFDQSIKNLVKVGDEVESDDILCVVEDAVTANNDLFDDESLDTLRILGSQNTPFAKVRGVVERIEMFYHGDKEDMSESLRTLANACDRDLAKRNKSAGRKAFTGSVDEGFRVDGDPLALDTIALKVYITSDVAAGEGDKVVFGNQMKSVVGKVLPGNIVSESGLEIDGIFGYLSISARIVGSPEIIGTTTTLSDVIRKQAVKIYNA